MTRIPSIVAAVLLAVGTANPARAAEPEDGYPLRLEVGEAVALCATGTILCPAGAVRCDDLTIVSVGGDERGPVLTGAKEGTTLCSAGSASGQGMRRVYRVTVVAKQGRPTNATTR